MKIISFYLPQYHTFPENDNWWGKGFTEWTNVKNAKPLYKGHYQPVEPFNDNYYNLLDVETIKWQSNLAKKYGIYGFCYYHYWFDGKMLMEKPMELMLQHKEIDFPFCICWANENWTRAWAKKSKEILIGQTYGDKRDWDRHFEYLYSFFNDERYIRIDDKPIMIIYRPEIIPTLREMLNYWESKAKAKGLKGICFIYQQVYYNHLKEETGDLFDYGIEYQPGFTMCRMQKRNITILMSKLLHEIVTMLHLPQTAASTIHYNYDEIWKKILKSTPQDEKMIPGAYVNWDNTPRYKKGATVHMGYSPEKFQRYLTEQIKRTKLVYRKDILFMFAWNEWGEGGYLEPDKKYKFAALEAVKNALLESGELLDN